MAHLNRSKRDKLEVLLKTGMKQEDIAVLLACNQSTISRELQRWPHPRLWYSAERAHQYADERRRDSYDERERWYDDPDVLRYVIGQLRKGKSPDAIAGRMKRKSPWHRQHAVSHQAIYDYIWKVKEDGGVLHKYLPRKGKRPKFYNLQGSSASHIPNRNDISERPNEVDRKSRCGDWESDLVVSGRNGSGAVATFVERYSKYCQAVLIADHTAEEMVRATKEVFAAVPKEFRLTMTHDNGSEIAKHEEITATVGIVVYCAEPYRSGQRGLNENTNGMLRRYFPKGTDFSQVSSREIAEAVEKINTLPRRSLNYLTSEEVFRWKIKGYAFQS